jgi:transcriptional regulator with XRE-family HTH domain
VPVTLFRYRFDGEAYKAERLRQGLSRADVASRLRCSEALVYAMETGIHANPGVAKAARFAAVLGRRVDDFIVDADESIPV